MSGLILSDKVISSVQLTYIHGRAAPTYIHACALKPNRLRVLKAHMGDFKHTSASVVVADVITIFCWTKADLLDHDVRYGDIEVVAGDQSQLLCMPLYMRSFKPWSHVNLVVEYVDSTCHPKPIDMHCKLVSCHDQGPWFQQIGVV